MDEYKWMIFDAPRAVSVLCFQLFAPLSYSLSFIFSLIFLYVEYFLMHNPTHSMSGVILFSPSYCLHTHLLFMARRGPGIRGGCKTFLWHPLTKTGPLDTSSELYPFKGTDLLMLCPFVVRGHTPLHPPLTTVFLLSSDFIITFYNSNNKIIIIPQSQVHTHTHMHLAATQYTHACWWGRRWNIPNWF